MQAARGTVEFGLSDADAMAELRRYNDPAAACPTFDRFIARVMADDADLIRYVQRSMGVCLTADVSGQSFHVFHGKGRTARASCATRSSG